MDRSLRINAITHTAIRVRQSIDSMVTLAHICWPYDCVQVYMCMWFSNYDNFEVSMRL